MTRRIRDNISEAADMIRKGGLVGVPTETVYGLACDGLNPSAVDRIYRVKGRPEVKPLSLMVPGVEAISSYCEEIPDAAYALAEAFWPGPLTIVLKAKKNVPEIVRAGGDTVGLRCPDHPLTLALLRACACPLAAPSANPSGQPSPMDVEQVLAYFDGEIEAVVDGGSCGIGRESTILDMSRLPYRILRHGALSEEKIREVLAANMRIVGITGPSGCGKTTALQVLVAFGAGVLDCDQVYHQLLEEDAALLQELDDRFPGTVQNQILNRKALAAVVFSDAAALADLNRITHAHIGTEITRRLGALAMEGKTLAALDAIELIGSGLSRRCDPVIGVLADKETRVRRIMLRDGITEDAARQRVDAQHSDAYFIEKCGYILYNNGTEEEFRDCLVNLYTEVL